MRDPSRFSRLRTCLLLALIASSVGCTTKFLYNQADWLAMWQLDRYFDLTSDQKEFLSSSLASILARHRKEALPQYERFLTRLRDQLSDGLTAEEVDGFFSAYRHLRGDLFERFVEGGSVFLTSVNDSQLQHLERAFARRNLGADRLLETDREKRLAQRAEWTVEWLTGLLGPLSAPQVEGITELSLGLPDTLPAWHEFQRQRQEAFLQLLRSRHDGIDVEQRLRQWLVYPEDQAPPSYQQAVENMQQGVKRMALSIDRIITTEQRQHTRARLQDLIATVHGLSGL